MDNSDGGSVGAGQSRFVRQGGNFGQSNQPGQPIHPNQPGQPIQPGQPGQPNQYGQPIQPNQPNRSSPVCSRHRDRVTHVTCQRCARPVCPECQVPAPVGVHCRQCRAADKRNAPRLVGGVKVGVTIGLIVLNVAFYLLSQLMPQLLTAFGFVPLFGFAQPYRFLTTAFLHGSVMHLLMNMWALYVIAPSLERILGAVRFLAVYIFSAIGGSLFVLLWAFVDPQSWSQITVGASSSVFGLLATHFVVSRKVRVDTSSILWVLAANFAIGFFIPNISWQGHLGGLVIGGLFAWSVLPTLRRDAASWRLPVLIVVWLLGLAAVIIGLLVAVAATV